MSEKDKKTTPEVKENKKAKKTSATPKKKENVFKRMWKNIKKFCKDFVGECKKVTWPTGKTVLNNSLVVIVVAAVSCLIIFGIDQGLAAIIKALIGLANNSAAASATTEAAKQMISMLFFL